MKLKNYSLFCFRTLWIALIAGSLGRNLALATPYATSLTNDGAGTISFRLNQTTTTNDSIWVISSGGAVTNDLQIPGTVTFDRGLIVTNLGIAPGTFLVRIQHVGTGDITTNSPAVRPILARGISVNTRPASPYFGWVYAAEYTAGTRNRGMFAFSSDLVDILGQGNVAKTGGYNFIGGGSPYHTSVAPDDSVLVTDWTDTQGNVLGFAPDLSAFHYVLKPFDTTGLPAGSDNPVGANNTHGSVIYAFIAGSGSTRKLYTMDEDYQTDPTSSAITELNSAWEYDIGTSVTYSNPPARKLMTPYLSTFTGQQEKCEVYGHYLYTNQRRSNPPQHSLYITDLNNLRDPSTFTGITPWGNFWASQDESLAEGYSDDVFRDTMTFSVSPDQKWLAAIIAAGSAAITAPDGSTFTNLGNDIILVPLTNGIPNLPARQVFRRGGAVTGRDVAFDAAHNLYFSSAGSAESNGTNILQSIDIGESTDVTTGSDGTFVFATPPTQVSVTATTSTAYEQGAVPGVFTISRSPDNLSKPVTVSYNLGGTARAGTNYAAVTNTITIAAGETSTNVLITPLNDGKADPVLTVTLAIRGAGDYSVGFPNSATVVIADSSTPQLRITSLSTNIFEGNPNDYAALSIQRWGDTNVSVVLDASNFAFGGTAVSNVDYYLTNLPYTLDPGVINATIPLIYPNKSSSAVGSLSILLTNVAGAGFTVSNNTASTAITLEGVPPETVLYSDNFENDPSGSNWKVAFQSYTNGSSDYSVVFGYDYTSGSLGNLYPIPAAPHSTNGDTKGLYMTVNKNAAISSGLNLYLKNHTFSGNYALRFDLFLVENSSGTAQSQVEDVLFGINHDGNHTNWFRNSVTGTSLPASPTLSDGLFFDIGADGNGGGGAPYDFAAWSGPTWTNTVNVVGPTNFLARSATTTRQIFKRPPFDSGTVLGGDPANQVRFGGFTSPTWVEVEVSQVQTALGNLITYKINNTAIMSFYNTNGVAATANTGTVMVGYCDPWDDLGNGSPSSGEACAIIDNLRVVQLSPPVVNVQPTNAVANVGGSATFVVGVSTVTGVTNYQWYANGVAIQNATNASLTINPVAFANYGTYNVSVFDGAYTSWSSNATLLPATGPVINTQPVSRAAVVGSSPSFSVTATTSSGVTNYQWFLNGNSVSGGTARTLTRANVQPASFGAYTVSVSDGFTSVTSSPPANLTFAVSPNITSPSVSGGNFNLTFNSEFGPAYVVDFKSNLTNATWTPVATNNGTGNPITVNLANPTPQGFYRIRLQ